MTPRMASNAPTARRRWSEPFSILRNRGFARIWTAGLISQSGDYMLVVALPFFVYRLTGSVLATGLMFLAAVAPPILISSLAGVFVDRWSRKWTMVGTNVVLGVGLLPLLWVTSPDRLWIVYGVALFEASVEPFFAPAEGALLPQLVPESDLLRANSLYGSSRQLARLLGAAAGGLAVGLWGLGGVAILDALTFFGAALLIAPVVERFVPRTDSADAVRQSLRRLLQKFRDEWTQGLRESVRTRQARAVVILVLLIGVGEGVVAALFTPFIVGILHGSALEFGAVVSLQAVGGIAGALAAASYGVERPPAWLLSRFAVVFALLDAALFTYPLVWPSITPALVLIMAVGVPGAIAMAGFTTLMQTAVPDASRGRFLGAVGTSSSIALVGGILLASSLADRIGIIPMLGVQVAVYLVGGLLFPWLLREGDEHGVPSSTEGGVPGEATAAVGSTSDAG